MAPPLPDDPILPGATWRPLEPQDAATLEALVEAARAADGGEEVSTGDDLLRELTDSRASAATNTLALAVPVGDPHVRADLSFVARAGDEAAGYERVGFRVNRRFVRLRRMVAA